jgi:hypothetical protein
MQADKALRIVNKSGEDIMVNMLVEKSYAVKVSEKMEASLGGGFKGVNIKLSGSYGKDAEYEWKKIDPGFFFVAKGQISKHSVDKGSDSCYVIVARKGFNYGSFAVTSVNGVYASIIVENKSVVEDKDYVLNFNCKPGSECKLDDHIVNSVRIEVGGLIYKYRVVVSVAEGRWDLQISDAEGDVYSLWCQKPGLHYVDYNSNDPSIVKIQRIFKP